MKKLLLTILLLFSFNQTLWLESWEIKYKLIDLGLYFKQYEIITNEPINKLYLWYHGHNYLWEDGPHSFISLEGNIFSIYVDQIVEDYEWRDTTIHFALYEKEDDTYKRIWREYTTTFGINDSSKLIYILSDENFKTDFNFFINSSNRLMEYKREVGSFQYSINAKKITDKINLYLEDIDKDVNNLLNSIRNQKDYEQIRRDVFKKHQKRDKLKIINSLLKDELVSLGYKSFPEYKEIYNALKIEHSKIRSELSKDDYSVLLKSLLAKFEWQTPAPEKNLDYFNPDLRIQMINYHIISEFSFEHELDSLFDLLK